MTTDRNQPTRPGETEAAPLLSGRRWWVACGFVLVVSLAVTVPTAGDLGLTWDEPAYRFSQQRSAQWWERLTEARSGADLSALVEPDALLFYWTYGRHGINFHPPLAGQLNLLTYKAFGGLMKDIPARRMASVIEFALTIALGFGFLARRYGPWVGVVMAGTLLLMPRIYGEAHVADTDTPGLLIWVAVSLAFWKGLYEPKGRRWRVLVGILMGLAFVQKMATVFVLVPIVIWLVVARLPKARSRADWVDGVVTSTAMLAPLGLALAEILRLARRFPAPKMTDLFIDRPYSPLPGLILALPLAIWLIRRFLGRVFPRGPVWGIERPALEVWTSVLAFAPIVGWLGNPAWWRETLPRLAHYYLLNTDRRGSLPDIHIFYLGKTYDYSLPWHSGWVLLAVTVPVATLAVALPGLIGSIRNARRDPLRLYFLLQFVTLPIFRMLPTPGHDGVRLFLPTFFFLAAMAGWGAVAMADLLAKRFSARFSQSLVITLVLIPTAWQLVKTHPYELSYYNELIGGPRGAWNAGFELSYWYDAFTPRVLADLNARLSQGVNVDFRNESDQPPTFMELQSLGQLRPDIVVGWRDTERFPYVWLLTHDSKSTPFTRFLFALKPWYASNPRQLDQLRVITVADPVAVSRAWALCLLTQDVETLPPSQPQAPGWVHDSFPFLGRLWGDGLTEVPRTQAFEPLFTWANTDPKGLLVAARGLSEHRESNDPDVLRLKAILDRFPPSLYDPFARILLQLRPEALVEAVQIVIDRPEAVRTVLIRPTYTDPETIGGPLDRSITH